MCNLYQMSASRAELAALFAAAGPGEHGNAPDETYPGTPGVVIAGGQVRQMVWGFPLQRTGARGQALKPKPVNNARCDRLFSPFWSASLASRRCLIPVTAFAEAQGVRGAKTRTWFSLPEDHVFAVAGLWRDSAEWGACYTMVMTDACIDVAGIHDRMPAILPREHWAGWLGEAPDAAVHLCRPWPGTMQIERTDERWTANSRR